VVINKELGVVDSRQLRRLKPVGRATLPLTHLGGKTGRARLLQRQLEQQPGVESAFVSVFTEMVFIIYDPQRTNLETLRQRVLELDTPENLND
jgi:hypothetical protein